MAADEPVSIEVLEERRKHVRRHFVPENAIPDSFQSATNPTGTFRLDRQRYSTGPKAWDYSRGIVHRLPDNTVVVDVKRNYGAFWHAWVAHPNGNEYLLCGEDYQGYTVVNLTQATINTYLPSSALQGFGFCWASVMPSPDGLTLAVEGCVWACPYEIVFYDFSNPEKLPLPELSRFDCLERTVGWESNDGFAFVRGYEVRKADGVPYGALSEEEQRPLDENPALHADVEEQVRWTRETPPAR